jgi:hypothetical protein
MGPIAQRNGMYAILHQNLQPGEPGWTFDKFLESNVEYFIRRLLY